MQIKIGWAIAYLHAVYSFLLLREHWGSPKLCRKTARYPLKYRKPNLRPGQIFTLLTFSYGIFRVTTKRQRVNESAK